MPQKWNLQDIRPARPEGSLPKEAVDPTPQPRRASQDIAPRRVPQQAIPQPTPETFQPQRRAPVEEGVESLDILDGRSVKRTRTIILVVLALLILGAALMVNILMGGAEITVYPKFKDVSVQASFTAYTSPKAGELGYELLTLEATGERQVKASGSEKVSERALGTMFIYNTDEKASQRLIKNTRFENPEGLIFRIKESVEVPKASKDAKGAIVPGVVTTEVFADGTGEQYNVGPARFTVPGLKGSPQYQTVYGETTVALTGGFEGDKYIIDESELETKKQELHLELRNSLLERLKKERPLGFIVYDSAVALSFESLPSTAYDGSLATIKEKAILTIPMFKEAEFAEYLAESTIAGYEREDVRITDPLALTFSYASATATVTNLSDYTELEFMLKGTARIVWQFDAAKLENEIKGLSKTALPAVLGGYPSIERAEAVVRPFWTQNFPENEKEIEVTTILKEKSAE